MQIIKIGAVWCPGCLVMNKIWNNILKNNDLDIIELDYDIDSDEARELMDNLTLAVTKQLN